MNTNHLKKFAQSARRQLLEKIGAKLEYVLQTDSAELRERAAAIQSLRRELNRMGKAQLVERVAYTWFNRLVALRFMDVNDYQPGGLRIVSPTEGHNIQAQLLAEAKQGHFPDNLEVDRQRILDLLDGRMPSRNREDEVYRLLLTAACNALHRQFPFLFEAIDDYTELLLPDDLTSELSIVHAVVAGMLAEDCQEVEIIGWLYQFYISEKKDAVFASKSKVKKEDIPAATQLFTPRWIVEYMVQNTLGKLWLQNRPQSRLREHMPYFIESPSLRAEDYLKVDRPEEIRLLDQACGSGHILVYAFELLTRIYEEEGYVAGEIPRLILENNLYGCEIDERAAQLAGFALLMKARGYYRRFFRQEAPEPRILCFEDVHFKENELENYLEALRLDMFSQDLQSDIRQFEQATNLGSLMRIRTKEIPHLLRELPTPDLFLLETHHKVKRVLRDMELLAQRYHCVVDNPPYMGSGNMNKPLSDFVKANYPDSKADLMAAFMEAGLAALEPRGFLGMINQHSWMFLSSYEKLRAKLIANTCFDTLLHLGPRTFPEIGGEVVQNTAFTFWNSDCEEKGTYLRLVDFDRAELKRTQTLEAINNPACGWYFASDQRDFAKIPGSPIGYWASGQISYLFKKNNSLSNYLTTRLGLSTANNDRFLKFSYEVNAKDFGIDGYQHSKKWYPYQKGGGFRKWFGNNEWCVNWENEGEEIRSFSDPKTKRIRSHNYNLSYIFREGITWSDISSGNTAFRYMPKGYLFDGRGSSGFIKQENVPLEFILAFLNSKVSSFLLKVINPTLVINVGEIIKQPFIVEDLSRPLIESLIRVSEEDWENHESSWSFSIDKLLRHRSQDIEESYDLYRQYWMQKFWQLHRNEEELNMEFIHIYGLQEELTPDVPLAEITILQQELDAKKLKALSKKYRSGWQLTDGEWQLPEQRPYPELPFDAQEVMAQFVSYAVGCMQGRYSLDREGLIIANQGETVADYLNKVGKPASAITFPPDEDGIIPVLDDEWFADDIVGQFYRFLRVSFGERDFARNLAFLEEQLGRDIRQYFVKDFYKDHIQRYKKRPIYWLFSSPAGHFRVLVYLHRYTPDTLNLILNHYLREFIQKLKAQRAHYEQLQVSGSATEQNQATKRIDQLDRMLLDCEAYERDILYPLATERIALDLDDGVLVNYNKLGRAVLEVPGLNDKKAKKKVRGFDWIDTSQIRG